MIRLKDNSGRYPIGSYNSSDVSEAHVGAAEAGVECRAQLSILWQKNL